MGKQDERKTLEARETVETVEQKNFVLDSLLDMPLATPGM